MPRSNGDGDVATCIATVAILILARESSRNPAYDSDFGLAWFGASRLLYEVDPYLGPGAAHNWGRPFFVSGGTLVAEMPFALLPEKCAAVVFLWISTVLPACGVTLGSWHRLPMFVTEAFASSARLAQWSIPLTPAFAAVNHRQGFRSGRRNFEGRDPIRICRWVHSPRNQPFSSSFLAGGVVAGHANSRTLYPAHSEARWSVDLSGAAALATQ